MRRAAACVRRRLPRAGSRPRSSMRGRSRKRWSATPDDTAASSIIGRMTQDELKALVGQAAIAYVEPGAVIGVGTGSTVNCFIDALGRMPVRIQGAVSSSQQSTERLQALGIEVLDANQVESLAVYIDGADEIDHTGCMVKGGGAALTREKIVADLSERFICIADESKLVTTLGRFPLPVEVIPMAAALITRRLRALGGEPVLRAGVVTDNGCHIIDVR